MPVPGEHFVVIGREGDAIEARRAGLHLRDTLLILLPGPRTIFAYLFRQPLEGTVAENVLRYGTGGLNIDGCRVGCDFNPSILRRETSRRTGTVPIPGSKAAEATARGRIERRGLPETYKAEHPGENLGRWPTNLLLVHGPGCVNQGEKRIPGHKGYPNGPGGKSMHYKNPTGARSLDVRSGAWKGHASPDGTETVPNWQCQPDCPVKLLDEQSGERGTNKPGSVVRKAPWTGFHGGDGTSGAPEIAYGDYGGASRFYPQFASFPEALDWLTRLVGRPTA